jgi:hypothetical protein
MLQQFSEKDFNLFQKLVKSKVGISVRPGKKNKKNVSGFGHQDVPPDRSLTV